MASRHKVVSSRRWEELHEELAESSAESSRLRTMYIATLQELSTAHQDAKSECIQAARLAVDERRRENKAVYEHNMRVEMAKAFEEGRQCQVGPMFGKDFEKTLELHDAYNILHEEQRSCFAAEREAKLLRVKLERSSADNRRHEEEAARNGKLEQEVESLRGKLEALKIAVKVEEVARSVQGQLVDMKQDDTTNDVPMELELPVPEAMVESPVPEAMKAEPVPVAMPVDSPVPVAMKAQPPAAAREDEHRSAFELVSKLGQKMVPPFQASSQFKRLEFTSVSRLKRELANGMTTSGARLHPLAQLKYDLAVELGDQEKAVGFKLYQSSFTFEEVAKIVARLPAARKHIQPQPAKQAPVKLESLTQESAKEDPNVPFSGGDSSSSMTLNILHEVKRNIDKTLEEQSGHSKEHAELLLEVAAKAKAIVEVAKDRQRKKSKEEKEGLKQKRAERVRVKEEERHAKVKVKEDKIKEKSDPIVADLMNAKRENKTLIDEGLRPGMKLNGMTYQQLRDKAELEHYESLNNILTQMIDQAQKENGDIECPKDEDSVIQSDASESNSTSSSSAKSGSDSDSD